uniref:COP9 signalosome complex subunit 5 n=1 Tax=Phakopsora pachyrhizi TaxID=170000 RepID=A0A0S1MKL1_PHAPC
MYSFASLAAFTLVSVPSTGSANESKTTKASPSILPCIRPITSYCPPDLACITILIRAIPEILTL